MEQKAAIIITREDGSILLQHRDQNAPTSPNVWGLWGGGIKTGETPKEAVVRELKEELELSVDVSDLSFFKSHKHSEDMVISAFLLRYDERWNPVQHEGDDMKFFSKEDIPNISLSQHTSPIINAYFEQ